MLCNSAGDSSIGIMWVFVILNALWGWLSAASNGGLLRNQVKHCWLSDVTNIGNSKQTIAAEKHKLHTRLFSYYSANFMGVCVQRVWLHVHISASVIAFSCMLSVPFPVSTIENQFTPSHLLSRDAESSEGISVQWMSLIRAIKDGVGLWSPHKCHLRARCIQIPPKHSDVSNMNPSTPTCPIFVSDWPWYSSNLKC